jgi:hypothetical protein
MPDYFFGHTADGPALQTGTAVSAHHQKRMRDPFSALDNLIRSQSVSDDGSYASYALGSNKLCFSVQVILYIALALGF